MGSEALEMARPVIFDTDIGTDIDDAYALALLLQCPELDLIGVTVGHGPTRRRSQIALKLLHLADRGQVPVAVGSERAGAVDVNQAPWADGFADLAPIQQPAAEFLVETITSRPGEITLICVGPYSNLGDALDIEPSLMDKVQRVVVMGGCLGLPDGATPEPFPDYNAMHDVEATQKLFSAASGLLLVPIDITRTVKLSRQNIQQLAEANRPLPRALTELYGHWNNTMPMLHDPLAVGMAVSERFCQVEPVTISVDGQARTRPSDEGTPMRACTSVDSDAFVSFFVSRLLD
jgi:inosine-uridine nucleoside N-ribohydrolase